MPYYVAPVAPDWTQTSPVYSMPMSPGFMQYGHVPRMRRFGGYGGYGGYNGSYGGGYKPRVMNFSDTPIDKQRLFVGNIPFATTWYELKAYLGSCGPVSHVEIQTNDVGDSLGFALVTFQDEETASKAIELFDGKMFEGRALKVHYDRVPPGRLTTSIRIIIIITTAATTTTTIPAATTAVLLHRALWALLLHRPSLPMATTDTRASSHLFLVMREAKHDGEPSIGII